MEIESLWRLSIGDFNPLFKNLRKIKEDAERQSAAQPSLSDEDRIVLRRELVTRHRSSLSGSYKFGDGLSLDFEADIDFIEESLPVDFICFRWEYRGAKYYQRIAVTSRPSNLGLREPVYYFLCPYSQTLCIKLYTDGRTLSGRRGFEHIYRKQTYSKNFRVFIKLLEISKAPEEGKNRKERYRGELTPYGKKMEKHLKKCLSFNLTKAEFWETFSRQKGRPRKGVVRPLPSFWGS